MKAIDSDRRYTVALILASISVAAAAQQAVPSAPAPESVPVRVVVRAADRAPLASAYVSLLPPERPAWRPLAEAIAPHGETTLRVPRGFYQVFAGSPGFQDSWRSVQIKAGTTLTFDLLPAPMTSGVLLDTSGKAIARANVTHLRASGPLELGQASVIARRYLHPNGPHKRARTGNGHFPAVPTL